MVRSRVIHFWLFCSIVVSLLASTPAAAGTFTVNRMCAAPVRWGAARLPAMGLRAVVANSGNANALTGPVGAADERAVAVRQIGTDPDIQAAMQAVTSVATRLFA